MQALGERRDSVSRLGACLLAPVESLGVRASDRVAYRSLVTYTRGIRTRDVHDFIPLARRSADLMLGVVSSVDRLIRRL